MVLVLAGCDAALTIQTPSDEADDPGRDTLEDPKSVGEVNQLPGDETAAPAPTRIWRLTEVQYERVLSTALGGPVDVVGFGSLDRIDDFPNTADLVVTRELVATLEEQVTTAVEEHSEHLEALLDCEIEDLDRPCMARFLEAWVPRVQRTGEYRGDLYLDLFGDLVEQNESDALIGVATAVLLSPKTLHRTELGPQRALDSAEVELTSYELAEALAFTLWNAPPDDALHALAMDGTLREREVFRAQVERMLEDPRALEGKRRFVLEWAGLTKPAAIQKDAERFPEWDEDLRDEMWAEATALVDDALMAGDGGFSDLLGSRRATVGPRLADLYGLPEIPSYETSVLLPSERRGLFTRAAVVAAMSEPANRAPMFRGKVLLRRLLCFELALPPAGTATLEETGPDATTRERFETLEEVPECAGCHTVLNPPAFAMQPFDALGRHQARENGVPIDASGTLTAARDDVSFGDAAELFDILADSPEVSQCFARHAFRFSLGRPATTSDRSTLDELSAPFSDHQNVSKLIEQLLLSDAFVERTRNTQ